MKVDTQMVTLSLFRHQKIWITRASHTSECTSTGWTRKHKEALHKNQTLFCFVCFFYRRLWSFVRFLGIITGGFFFTTLMFFFSCLNCRAATTTYFYVKRSWKEFVQIASIKLKRIRCTRCQYQPSACQRRHVKLKGPLWYSISDLYLSIYLFTHSKKLNSLAERSFLASC